jgi:hypothetical protein
MRGAIRPASSNRRRLLAEQQGAQRGRIDDLRGGTPPNKLHFPASLRDSEDIDLVRTSAGCASVPIVDRSRAIRMAIM